MDEGTIRGLHRKLYTAPLIPIQSRKHHHTPHPNTTPTLSCSKPHLNSLTPNNQPWILAHLQRVRSRISLSKTLWIQQVATWRRQSFSRGRVCLHKGSQEWLESHPPPRKTNRSLCRVQYWRPLQRPLKMQQQLNNLTRWRIRRVQPKCLA